ncbi:MAG: hypothetical protein Q8O23_02455 [Gallionella sp.]|nr:hypothetical protein [Gallionella sp.]
MTPWLTILICTHNRAILEDLAARPGALLRFVTQCVQQSIKALGMPLTGQPGALRQAMNATHAMGSMVGYAGRPRP